MNFYGLFEILQLEFEDRLSPLISELCFLDAAVLIDVSKSIDTTERKKLKDFFNKIVDKMTVTWALSLLARMSLSYSYCTKKYHIAAALNERVCGHHISWLNQTWNLHRPCRRSGRESNIYQLRGRQTQSTLGEISHIYMYKKTNKWTNWFVVGEQ